MADPQGLFDILSGAAGAPVDRPKLDAFVANSQAINGLRSAQTSEAMLNAQRSVEEAQARSALRDHFQASGLKPSDAQLATDLAVGGLGNASQVMEALHTGQKVQANYTLGDVASLGTPAAVAAGQVEQGKPADPYTTVPGNYTPTPGMAPQGPVQTNPSATAQIGAENALAGLHDVQAAAGGFNPHTAGGGVGLQDPADIAALNKAINERRLDPNRINSRTAQLFAQLEKQSGGTIDFNSAAAEAAAQRNVGFQTKAIGIESMPTILQHMTTLGKALEGGQGYSNWRTAGKIQQIMNGETNDPSYTEYMSVRNDTLLKIASLMRGVGMSDQAHTAEIEAAAPTLSPLALDGWLKGQMATLKPTYDAFYHIHHLGESAAAANAAKAGAGAPGAPGAPASAPTPDLAALAAAELQRRGIAPQPAPGGP